jgi:cobalamin biosynthesis protein CobT
MFYKSTGAWGIRQKGGPQVMQIVLKGKTRAESEPLARDVVALLEGGNSVAEVKAWVAAELTLYAEQAQREQAEKEQAEKEQAEKEQAEKEQAEKEERAKKEEADGEQAEEAEGEQAENAEGEQAEEDEEEEEEERDRELFTEAFRAQAVDLN